mmetsp:Transcript_50791/g.168237  ORF Transcript_50791/g.168237 Transcript_50791/m.168237 type:complete len:90 (+) Transcript_50791:609-878(+)
MLIGAGAAVDIASSDGTSALFMACQPGHTRSAELLLEGGASASLAGHEDGSTPAPRPSTPQARAATCPACCCCSLQAPTLCSRCVGPGG